MDYGASICRPACTLLHVSTIGPWISGRIGSSRIEPDFAQFTGKASGVACDKQMAKRYWIKLAVSEMPPWITREKCGACTHIDVLNVYEYLDSVSHLFIVSKPRQFASRRRRTAGNIDEIMSE